MKSPTHLNALRAFEATARCGGYAAAAREIGVTPEAVGQLVRGLEAYLGLPLFARGAGRGLTPTPEALTVLPGVTDAMKVLVGAADRLRALKGSNILTITVAPSIAAKWLAPRLPSFLSVAPDLDVRLDITSALRDVGAGEADAAIRYGRGGWSDLVAQTLFDDETLAPVCAPSFLTERRWLRAPKDLIECVLIHDVTVADPAYPKWRDWFRAAGVVGDEGAKMLTFNAALMAIDAAKRGQGVALARDRLVQDELARGRLVRLFPDLRLSTGWRYAVVTPPAASAAARAFAEWAGEEALKTAEDDGA